MHWDYLILTASNPRQARAYESQMAVRREAGSLPGVGETLVVADLEGRRVGSGGSTLECLRLVANRERRRRGGTGARDWLSGLRILIVHAGGDSRRLPAYAPCGKIFVPVPGESDVPYPLTLFDRLIPPFLDLPAPEGGGGQVVVTAGDALLLFDAAGVEFRPAGLTMLASPATPEKASRHGVFCLGRGGDVRLYLQKPARAEQEAMGAIDASGQTLLDIGVASFDAAGASALLDAFEVGAGAEGDLEWSPDMRERLLSLGVDLYREICCAMGNEATVGHYVRTARSAGSKWSDAALTALFPPLRSIPLHVRVVPGCRFLHFGSTRQLAASGAALMGAPSSTCLSLNNEGGEVSGVDSWVEGCRLRAPLTLGGRNVVVGVDLNDPVELPEGAALDISPGHGVHYVRCYGVNDSFKDATFCGRPLERWLEEVGAITADVWEGDDRSLWTARVFPSVAAPGEFHRWLWMYRPESASEAQKREWRETARFSAAEISVLTDQDAFHLRRASIRHEATC